MDVYEGILGDLTLLNVELQTSRLQNSEQRKR